MATSGDADGGLARYFRYTLDHKVVGLQYLVGMLVYFFTGGLLAIGDQDRAAVADATT